jgi:beta-phosphoglucomutase-like phosphatase (HAD superfamily)
LGELPAIHPFEIVGGAKERLSMSVWNDMASDAGYRYSTSENEQMAAMLDAEEYQQQCGREAEARAAAEAEAGEQQATQQGMPETLDTLELPF